jgi:hypothetical protein
MIRAGKLSKTKTARTGKVIASGKAPSSRIDNAWKPHPLDKKVILLRQNDRNGFAKQLFDQGSSAASSFFCEPSHSRIRPILEKRGWTWIAKPSEASLIWYQKKTHIKWKDVAPWTLANHFEKEREIGHKGKLADNLLQVKCVLAVFVCAHSPHYDVMCMYV